MTLTSRHSRHALRWLAPALLGALPLVGVTTATADDAPGAPDPAAAAAARRWRLDFTHGPLRRIQASDGSGTVRTVYYMRMTVGNKTGLPRAWRPFVTAKADSRPAAYVAGGFPAALPAIRAAEGADNLESIEASGWKKGDEGKIANGQTLDLVAVFGPVDPQWNTLRIEVNGLINSVTTLKIEKYGDKEIVADAAYASRNAKAWDEIKAAARAAGGDVPAPTSEYREVLERRAYVINYLRQGDEFRPDDDPVVGKGEGWEVVDVKVVAPLK